MNEHPNEKAEMYQCGQGKYLQHTMSKLTTYDGSVDTQSNSYFQFAIEDCPAMPCL